jgi:hypothetical protein
MRTIQTDKCSYPGEIYKFSHGIRLTCHPNNRYTNATAVYEMIILWLAFSTDIIRCPKTMQISESIREEVPSRGNFVVIRGNDALFPRPGNFLSMRLPPSEFQKFFRFLGKCI